MSSAIERPYAVGNLRKLYAEETGQSISGQRYMVGLGSGRRVVSAFIATAFAQDDAKQARAQWRRVADQLKPKVPKLLL